MAHKDKHKTKTPGTGDRQREIDRLEKDVEELRHMAIMPAPKRSWSDPQASGGTAA